MNKGFALFILFATAAAAWAGDSIWLVEKSVIRYHADHPFHNTIGKTEAAKGKGVCEADGCNFLVAVPVKTFDSGDQNRDLHMIQAVHGGEFPMVSVRVQIKAPPKNSFKTDLTVEFGGKQTTYKDVGFDVSDQSADAFRVKGTIPLLLSRHGVDRPSLMGVAIKDEAPVDIDVLWKRAPQK